MRKKTKPKVPGRDVVRQYPDPKLVKPVMIEEIVRIACDGGIRRQEVERILGQKCRLLYRFMKTLAEPVGRTTIRIEHQPRNETLFVMVK